MRVTTHCHWSRYLDMPVEPDNTIKVTFRGRCFGQQIIMDLSYVCTVGPAAVSTEQELLNIADAVQVAPTDIRTAYLACLPPEYTLDEIRAQVLFPQRSAYSSYFPIAGTAGTNANSATVSNDAAAITRRTAAAGRSQISTLKIGPAPDAVSTAGVLTNGYRTLLATLATRTLSLVTTVSTGQYRPIILSAPVFAPSPRFLSSFRIGIFSRVNRRRTVGLGE